MPQAEDARHVVVEASAEQAVGVVTELFASIVCEAVEKAGNCYLALSGGTTPYALYKQLAAEAMSGKVPWQDVEIFFGDERDVPHDHVESNYGRIQQILLDHVPVRPDRVHPMPADSEDLTAAAGQYEQTIRRIVPAGKDGKPRFDLILLGMGGDGHVASLFPATDALETVQELVTACFVPVLGRHRMTFTFPLINAAGQVILLVTGGDKAEAVATLLGNDEELRQLLPAANVAPKEGKLSFVFDVAAGRQAGLRPEA